MTATTRTFYRKATGMLEARTVYCDADIAAINVDATFGLIDGVYDRLSQKVDTTTGLIVSYQPPPPGDTANTTYAWDVPTSRWVGTQTAAYVTATTIATYEAAVQAEMDSTARAWGYDSLLSAASYAASAVLQYKADSLALVAWRDALWIAAYALEQAVIAGTQTLPATTAAFLALLPPPPARPVA